MTIQTFLHFSFGLPCGFHPSKSSTFYISLAMRRPSIHTAYHRHCPSLLWEHRPWTKYLQPSLFLDLFSTSLHVYPLSLNTFIISILQVVLGLSRGSSNIVYPSAAVCVFVREESEFLNQPVSMRVAESIANSFLRPNLTGLISFTIMLQST